ncbi:hypothetical protein [Chryseobacterium sp. GP-SGM7]|uniref:hypothetical protein n=1 Tax=Chryseobacterium sp. GP-SGM7 TaxID=3411323 RepID=UPI003B958FD6
MKYILGLSLLLCTFFSYAQNYPFATEFVTGKVVLKDLSEQNGQIKWYPTQNDKLHFRTDEKAKPTKYNPSDIAGFSSENLKFVPLYNFKAYADNFALVGTPTKITETFGEVVSEGKFNIYFTSIRGYNALSRTLENYHNFVFQDANDPEKKLYAYPYMIRMKEKKYEKAKEDLYILFKDYPKIIEKIKAFKKEDDFSEVVKMIENLNQ